MHTSSKLIVYLIALHAGLVFANEPQPAQPGRTQEIMRAGEQSSIAGPGEYFTGRVRVDPIWPTDQNINAAGALVTFEPGARSAWLHTPPGSVW